MGRQDDVFYLQKENEEGYEKIVPDFIRRAVMQMHPDITAFCAIQKSAETIEVQLLPEGLKDCSMLGFESLWASKKVKAASINVVAYTHVPSTTKLRRIRRSFEPAESL